MGDSQMVKVRCVLDRGKRQPKARVSIARWNLKEAGCFVGEY